MLKIGLMIAIPSIFTYVGATYFQSSENIFYIFALSVAALAVAILSQIKEKSGS